MSNHSKITEVTDRNVNLNRSFNNLFLLCKGLTPPLPLMFSQSVCHFKFWIVLKLHCFNLIQTTSLKHQIFVGRDLLPTSGWNKTLYVLSLCHNDDCNIWYLTHGNFLHLHSVFSYFQWLQPTTYFLLVHLANACFVALEKSTGDASVWTVRYIVIWWYNQNKQRHDTKNSSWFLVAWIRSYKESWRNHRETLISSKGLINQFLKNAFKHIYSGISRAVKPITKQNCWKWLKCFRDRFGGFDFVEQWSTCYL